MGKEGFIERLIKHKSVYQAFYGSFWWCDRIFIVYHIGACVLKYLKWRNSKIPKLTLDECEAKYGPAARADVEAQIKKHMEGKVFIACR